MAQIAVAIIDPRGNRSAHLVENRLLIREVIPQIVTALKLPEGVTYQLIPMGGADALPVDQSLTAAGIPPGAELQLKPVRNRILKALLDKLYEEATGYVEDQLWELAKEKLEELLQLDPNYPDPRDLKQAVKQRVPSLHTVPRTGQFSSAGGKLASSSRAPIPPAPRPSGTGVYKLDPAAAKSAGWSCALISVLLIVVVVGGAAVVGALFFADDIWRALIPSLDQDIPNDETITLGTGDVQVTLRWEGDADLDLHVVDPNGEEIWFGANQSTSGGMLDVDANGQCERVQRPVENVFWPDGEAPRGTYEVSVVYFQACGRTEPVNYAVTITLDRQVVNVFNDQMTSVDEEDRLPSFQY